MNETIKTLTERRSVRGFGSQQITDEQINSIVTAGQYAPTGHNRQSPVMVVVQNPQVIARLSEMNAAVLGSNTDPFYGAAAIIVVLADSTVPTYLYDGSLVMGNLMNAAYSVGVDSCWIHRAKEVFASDDGQALLKKWGIDNKNLVGIGHCALGIHSADYPPTKPRKENYVYYVK